MLILNEETVKEFIKNENVFIKVWSQNCSFCSKLDEHLGLIDISKFQCGSLEVSHPMDRNPKPSEFKRTWMKVEKSDVVKDTVPALFIFHNGELKHRHFGMLYPDALQHWLETGTVIPSKLQQEEKKLQDKQKRLFNLFAQRGELTFNIDLMNAKLIDINKEIMELTK